MSNVVAEIAVLEGKEVFEWLVKTGPDSTNAPVSEDTMVSGPVFFGWAPTPDAALWAALDAIRAGQDPDSEGGDVVIWSLDHSATARAPLFSVPDYNYLTWR